MTACLDKSQLGQGQVRERRTSWQKKRRKIHAVISAALPTSIDNGSRRRRTTEICLSLVVFLLLTSTNAATAQDTTTSSSSSSNHLRATSTTPQQQQQQQHYVTLPSHHDVLETNKLKQAAQSSASVALNPRTRIVDEHYQAQHHKGSWFAPILPLLGDDNNLEGHEASAEQYPYFVQWPKAYCGASLIWDDIVLTAAHCKGKDLDNPFENKEVQLLSDTRKQGITRSIVHRSVHPKWNNYVHEYDFQLLKLDSSALEEPVHNNNSQSTMTQPTGVEVIKLNRDSNFPPPGTPLQAMGFGATSKEDHAPMTDKLLDTTVYTVSQDECSKAYGPQVVIPEIMLCDGHPGGGKDTCQGDSGGPIVVNGTQVGVVSWAIGCALENYPGINSRVSGASDWIDSEICRLSNYPPASCAPESTISITKHFDKHPGHGELRVSFQHDQYPQEVAWSLLHLDSTNELFYQPYNSNAAPFIGVSRQFGDLPAGTYRLSVGDAKKDGICCKYGKGGVAITNHHGRVLWEHSGNYSAFLQVDLEIDDEGNLVGQPQETTEYECPSTKITYENSHNFVNDPAHKDPAWPGPYPKVSPSHAITINVKSDNHPEADEWGFFRQQATSAHADSSGGDKSNNSTSSSKSFWDSIVALANGTMIDSSAAKSKSAEHSLLLGPDASQWVQIHASDSNTGLPNTVESIPLTNLTVGKYMFLIQDDEGDGICCLRRFGWITMLSRDPNNHEEKMVYQNNGEFGSEARVILQLLQDGAWKVLENTQKVSVDSTENE